MGDPHGPDSAHHLRLQGLPAAAISPRDVAGKSSIPRAERFHAEGHRGDHFGWIPIVQLSTLPHTSKSVYIELVLLTLRVGTIPSQSINFCLRIFLSRLTFK